MIVTGRLGTNNYAVLYSIENNKSINLSMRVGLISKVELHKLKGLGSIPGGPVACLDLGEHKFNSAGRI